MQLLEYLGDRGGGRLAGDIDGHGRRLLPDGRAWLVVHKHLGSDSLATWLVEQGFSVERVSSKRGYRMLRVSPAGGRQSSTQGGS